MENNNNKQRLLIEYLISSADTFAVCKGIVKSQYFDPEFRKTVDFVHDYYDKYNTTPDTNVVLGETNLVLKKHQITRDQIEYCTNEVEQFCRRRAMKQAVVAAASMLDGDGGEIEALIKEAQGVTLNRSLGQDYFADAAERHERQKKTPQRTPTKWTKFDDALGGGIARKEILLFSANSGGGKSITLANLALNFIMQGLNVMYISLELPEDMISQRFDTMITEIPSVNWLPNSDNIVSDLAAVADTLVMNQNGEKVPVGWINIHHMPSGSNANKIRAYLKEYQLKTGRVPDMLVVDYLDLMGANEHVSADNISEKDKRATEQLRDILFDYNMFGATASQQTRGAITADSLNQGHIAGGITKVNTVDWYVTIIMDSVMKAAGEMILEFLKSRSSDAVGKRIHLKWDNNALRVKNFAKDDADEDGVIENKITAFKSRKAVSMDDLYSMAEKP